MGRMPLSPRRTAGQVPQSLETALEDVMVEEALEEEQGSSRTGGEVDGGKEKGK